MVRFPGRSGDVVSGASLQAHHRTLTWPPGEDAVAYRVYCSPTPGITDDSPVLGTVTEPLDPNQPAIMSGGHG